MYFVERSAAYCRTMAHKFFHLEDAGLVGPILVTIFDASLCVRGTATVPHKFECKNKYVKK